MAKKINRRGRRVSQRVVILLCVPLRSLRFFESSQKIIKSLKTNRNIVDKLYEFYEKQQENEPIRHFGV
jgi:hypothetical protein